MDIEITIKKGDRYTDENGEVSWDINSHYRSVLASSRKDNSSLNAQVLEMVEKQLKQIDQDLEYENSK